MLNRISFSPLSFCGKPALKIPYHKGAYCHKTKGDTFERAVCSRYNKNEFDPDMEIIAIPSNQDKDNKIARVYVSRSKKLPDGKTETINSDYRYSDDGERRKVDEFVVKNADDEWPGYTAFMLNEKGDVLRQVEKSDNGYDGKIIEPNKDGSTLIKTGKFDSLTSRHSASKQSDFIKPEDYKISKPDAIYRRDKNGEPLSQLSCNYTNGACSSMSYWELLSSSCNADSYAGFIAVDENSKGPFMMVCADGKTSAYYDLEGGKLEIQDEDKEFVKRFLDFVNKEGPRRTISMDMLLNSIEV